MAGWLRFSMWDFSLDDVVAVGHLAGGRATVFLRGGPTIELDEAEAKQFLARFARHAHIEDVDSAAPSGR